ncbi:MAG: hypothetical protein EOP06_03200 [Proteobacteria bacterium]|nr:MAG: hypothetical protein EOP06_03200 [Pseudomonadota bacterium]
MIRRGLALCILVLQVPFSYVAGAEVRSAESPAQAEISANAEYFAALLKRGPAAPLKDFLVLWKPEQAVAASNPDLSKCTMIESVCSIDTIYSWGSKEKLTYIEGSMPDGEQWIGAPNGNRAIYALFSAVGTYAYGDIPVRIKLKPNSFEVFPNWEVKLTDASVIDSWSFGTAEQYDEIVRDLRQFQSGKLWFGYHATKGIEDGSKDRLFYSGLLDNHAFTEASLKKSLLNLIEMILRKEGRINFSAGACRNRVAHFSTSYPTYIIPFQSEGTTPSWRKSWMAPD